MAKIVHVIQQISRGGGARATIYLAKYSARFGGHDHTILSLNPGDSDAIRIAQENDIRVANGLSGQDISSLIDSADVVQLSWWNNPQMQRFMQELSVPIRSIGWFHVGGTASPQVVSPKLVDYFDCAVACSPYTYQASAFQSLPAQSLTDRTALVYGATDFARLEGFTRNAHDGFNVGYIGTLDFLKMHRSYVSMSMNANIPDAKFLFCGSGSAREIIKLEAEERGVQGRFVDMGYLDDIKEMLSILDVYGYPLCAETYAASEMNLQEVMYAGIPAVVFPYGGVKELVTHNETALVVHSEEEYSQALQYLYTHPEERERIGRNAHAYAQRTFGAENAGKDINRVYEKVLTLPKRIHKWGGTDAEKVGGRVRPIPGDLFLDKLPSGSRMFVDSLGFQSLPFIQSLFGATEREQLIADRKIVHCSPVLRQSGINSYKDEFPDDPYLRYWAGLACLGLNLLEESIINLVDASKTFSDWRVFLFIYQAARMMNHASLVEQVQPIMQRIQTPERTQLLAELFPSPR